MTKEEYYGVTEFEDQLDMFDELDYSLYDVDVSYEFAMDLEYPEITLEEFEKNGLINRNSKLGKNTYGEVGRYKDTTIYEVPFHNASIRGKANYYELLIGSTTSSNNNSSSRSSGTLTRVSYVSPALIASAFWIKSSSTSRSHHLTSSHA